MKTFKTLLLVTALVLMSGLTFANSNYCEKETWHFDNPAETGSAIYLTISKIDANSMYVEIESASGEAVDDLLVNGADGFSKSENDTTVTGKIRRILTATGEVPDSVSMQILWSKKEFGGMWQLGQPTFTVPFDASCTLIEDDTEAPENFTASISDTSFTSVDFTLSGTDNSGTVMYEISYDGTTVNTSGASGVEEIYTLTGLTDATAYSFSISAMDAAGNTASNNPIEIDVTTKALPVLDAAPAAPTKDAVNVISVYSDTYTSNATNLNPGWGQATVFSELDFSGNNVIKYEDLDYQGLEYTSSDVSSMLYVHFDYWTVDATALQFYLIAGGENAYDVAATDGITTGEWVGVDIPLSYFADAGRDLTAAFQFKTVGNGTIYLDNLYFWKNPTAATEDVTLSSLLVDGVAIDDFGPAKISYTVDLPYGTTEVPVITVTTTNSNATHIVNAASSIPGTTTINVTSESENTEMAYTVDFTATLPTSAAPQATHNAVDVIAVYCGEYATNIASNLNPGWGQETQFSTVELDGDEAMKYANLNYQGLEYTNSDISSMEYVHLDYWTTDASAFQFSLIADGENAYDIAASEDFKVGQWVSLDIPLSYFADAGRDLTAAIQFKTVGNGTIYLDNLYFWKTPTPQNDDATLSMILVDGDSLASFTSLKSDYTVSLPYQTSTVPTVTATPSNSEAKMTITPATSIPGITSIEIISESESDTITYTISFTDNIPLTKAPTPTQSAEDVIAVYSDAYTNTIATNLNPGWGQSTQFSTLNVDDDEMMQYANLNYQGVEYTEADVSSMEYLHFDYWTTDATALEFYLIADEENSYNVASELGIKTGQWVSVDVPLTHYSDAGRDLTMATQFKIVGDGTICFDNYYFYKTDAAAVNDIEELKLSVYPNPTSDLVNIKSQSNIETLQVYSLSGKRLIEMSPNTTDVQMDISSLSSGAYLINVTTDESARTIKIIKQ